MTLYYLFNPRIFIDPGWLSPPGGEEFKRRRVVDVIASPTTTPELRQKVAEFAENGRKLAASETISEENGQNSQKIIERERILQTILDMEEEETALMLLMMLDD